MYYRIMIATIRDFGLYPCPRCLIQKEDIYKLATVLIEIDLFLGNFAQAGEVNLPGRCKIPFFFPWPRGGFTPPYNPDSPDGGFPRCHPAWVGPPDQSGISPMDQGVLGCRDRGNLPSRGTPGLPPGAPPIK